MEEITRRRPRGRRLGVCLRATAGGIGVARPRVGLQCEEPLVFADPHLHDGHGQETNTRADQKALHKVS